MRPEIVDISASKLDDVRLILQHQGIKSGFVPCVQTQALGCMNKNMLPQLSKDNTEEKKEHEEDEVQKKESWSPLSGNWANVRKGDTFICFPGTHNTSRKEGKGCKLYLRGTVQRSEPGRLVLQSKGDDGNMVESFVAVGEGSLDIIQVPDDSISSISSKESELKPASNFSKQNSTLKVLPFSKTNPILEGDAKLTFTFGKSNFNINSSIGSFNFGTKPPLTGSNQKKGFSLTTPHM